MLTDCCSTTTESWSTAPRPPKPPGVPSRAGTTYRPTTAGPRPRPPLPRRQHALKPADEPTRIVSRSFATKWLAVEHVGNQGRHRGTEAVRVVHAGSAVHQGRRLEAPTGPLRPCPARRLPLGVRLPPVPAGA